MKPEPTNHSRTSTGNHRLMAKLLTGMYIRDVHLNHGSCHGADSILQSNGSTAAATILDKFCEGTSKNPRMKLVGGMTLRKLASLPQSAYLQPHLEEFDKELQAIKCV